MRLFAGIELDEGVKAAAARVIEDLATQLGRVSPGFDARWVPPATLHLTLSFLGEVADERVSGIAAQLRPPFRECRFHLTLRGCGAFPRSGHPRVVWIGLEHGVSELVRLQGEVAARLEPLGFPPERRAYAPHLTIARVKNAGRAPAALRHALRATAAACGPSEVGAVTLFRSRLSPRGSAYEPLERVPLP